jgi:hypothetical protein
MTPQRRHSDVNTQRIDSVQARALLADFRSRQPWRPQPNALEIAAEARREAKR